MSIVKRIAGLAVVVAAAASVLVAVAAPASANQDSLWFGKIGETTGSYGPNQAVRIWGDLSFKNEGCPEDGVPDFVYPTSDVYIVVPGTAVGHLVDVTGNRPNTVVQYASVFDDEVIGITTPAGSLQGGEYDVVFDTCQDGVFDPDQDTVFSRVLTVTIPGDLPPADAALTSLKEASYEEYESWKNTSRVINGVWKLVDKALSSGCRAGNPTACALKYGNYFSPIQKQFDGLLLNQGQHYLGIYEDPPNPNYKSPIVLEQAAGDALAGEAAITKALLAAIEAYKGAQAAGDSEWALVHARTVVDLYAALEDQVVATSAQLQGVADGFTNAADEGIVFARQYLSRVFSAGFTADERRTMAENGMTRQQITAYETELRRHVQPHWTAAGIREVLEAQIETHTATATAVAEGRAAWTEIVAGLVADKATKNTHPVADAGSGYTVVEGTPIQLDGSASTAAAGESIESYAWDLDGDRDFDDATGATPTVTFDEPGAPVIALRVTDGDGRKAYDFSAANVTRKGALPVITGTAPTGHLVKPTVNKPTTFTVTATDDTGAPQVSWKVDGEGTGSTGNSFVWTAPGEPGVHQVTATATDADGHTSSRSWDVLVRAVDGDSDTWTAKTDCDDNDSTVHPGQLEFLGNGVNDDCDAGTPDAPVGGLTGKPYGWGHPHYNATGAGVINWSSYQLPLPTNLGDDVVKIEQGRGAGFAVLADDTVRSWGYPSEGQLGNGTVGPNAAYTPVQPKGPGGEGVLTSIRSIDESHAHVVAVRTDGKVVTWGDNNLSKLGDGSTVSYRPYPDFVLTGPGGEPLSNVKSVAAGYQADYALMNDGTVMAWGYVQCDGAPGGEAPYTPYPTKVEQLEGGVRQIANGSGIILFLMKDGRVLSCGATDPQLGRKWGFDETNTPYRPRQVDGLGVGSGVVDMTIHGDSAAVLKENGDVLIWGENTNASVGPVCGLPDCTLKSPTLAPMPAGAQIIDVENEDSATTLALRADGTMLVWGGNTYGAGGLGDLPGSDFVPTPTVVDVAGRHIVAISSSVWNGMALTRPADDPTLPVPARHITASVADATIEEATDGGFQVTLSEAHSAPISLDFAVAAGTAGAADVAIAEGTVTVPAGSTTALLPVDVTSDVIDEDDETFTVALRATGLGVQVERAQATGTIVDDDAAPTVSVESKSVVEGNTSLTDTPVRFVLSAPSGKEVVATYATTDGTATAGVDYVASAATIRFAPGETEDVVHMATAGDTALETDETFTVSLGEVTNGTAGGSGTVTISDDEKLTVAVTAPSISEGTGTNPKAQAVVTVTPAPLEGEVVTVPWTVVEPELGEGDAAGDVVVDNGTVELSAETPAATVEVEIVADELDEESEPFLVQLGAAGAGARTVLLGKSVTGWIADDDRTNTAPTVEAGDPVTGTEGAALPLAGSATDDTGVVSAKWTVDGPCVVTGNGPTASVTCDDNGTFVATLTATDDDGVSTNDTTTLAVSNAAPVLGDAEVVASGASAPFTDAGAGDTHECTIDWGDGQTGTVSPATTPCSAAHDFEPGTWEVTITVTDDDGGSATTTETLTIAPSALPFDGFFAPVDNLPTVNVVQAGSSVPIKFSLGGYRGQDIFAPGSPSSRPVGCTAGATDGLEETATPGASGLTYDSDTDRYHYVWKTSKSWKGSCREFVLTLRDGSTHTAAFRFR